eukprot:COSAG01_NODE_10832_length_2072_cov_1.223517_1_plen_104_part_00
MALIGHVGGVQELVKRIVGDLQKQSYRVWIDIQQMQGSTIEVSVWRLLLSLSLSLSLSLARALTHTHSVAVCVTWRVQAMSEAIDGADIMLYTDKHCRLDLGL